MFARELPGVSLGLTTSCLGTCAILARCRWAYASTGLIILVNSLKLVENPNGSMSTARRCHRDRSIGNITYVSWVDPYMKVSIFQV